MDEATFKQKLHELIGEIERLPAPRQKALKDLATQAQEQHRKLAASAKSVAEALDYLRLHIKYLVFDLEATRRENRYLRKMLESRPPNQNFGNEPPEGDEDKPI
ncbi:MAG: transcriptional regulator [Planctomycetota bacterium]